MSSYNHWVLHVSHDGLLIFSWALFHGLNLHPNWPPNIDRGLAITAINLRQRRLDSQEFATSRGLTF